MTATAVDNFDTLAPRILTAALPTLRELGWGKAENYLEWALNGDGCPDCEIVTVPFAFAELGRPIPHALMADLMKIKPLLDCGGSERIDNALAQIPTA